MRIIVLTADGERFRGALVTAAARAALGGRAAIFLQLDAVALLRAPIAGPRDAAHAAAGLPSLAALIDDVLALGVALTACQSGLTLCGMTASDLPAGVETGGPVGFLRDSDTAQLLLA